MKIRACVPDDAEQIVQIYNLFIQNSTATFEEDSLSAEVMAERITTISQDYPFLIGEQNNQIIGYAYASRWKERSAYRYTAETTVYVKQNSQGNGLGRALYQKLFEELKSRGFHCGLAGITLPNEASVKFHESLGFEKVGQLKDVGFKFGRWIDVGYWEIVF